MKILTKNQKGFTVTELLIYMAIFSILLVVLTEIFVTSLKVQLESQASSSVEQDSKFILSRLIYDIQRADQIIEPVNIGDQGTTLRLNIGGTSYTYTISGTNLTLSTGGTPEKLNSVDSDIKNVVFQKLGNSGGENSVSIQYSVVSKIVKISGTEIRNVQTVVGLRQN